MYMLNVPKLIRYRRCWFVAINSTKKISFNYGTTFKIVVGVFHFFFVSNNCKKSSKVIYFLYDICFGHFRTLRMLRLFSIECQLYHGILEIVPKSSRNNLKELFYFKHLPTILTFRVLCL